MPEAAVRVILNSVSMDFKNTPKEYRAPIPKKLKRKPAAAIVHP
jgi:hypothetical protein